MARSSMVVRALPALGAEVRGVSLADCDDDELADLVEVWHRHAVLVFPGQHLSEAAQVAFSLRLGPLERGVTRPGAVGEARIGRLANVGADGGPVPEGSSLWLFLKGNQDWHSDSSFKAVSAKASLLSAWRVPSRGGETEWADMRQAWDALPARTQARLEGLVAVHSYWWSQSQVGGTDVLSPEDWAALPPVEHPLVRTNEDTGRRSLFIGRHASHIRGMDEEAGRRLLGALCRWATRPCWRMRHRWAPGDAVLWDNRSVLHRGRPWPADEVRVMKRTTIAGSAADEAAPARAATMATTT